MTINSPKRRGLIWQLVAYLVAGGAALSVVSLALSMEPPSGLPSDWWPWVAIGLADLVGTLIIFAFSVGLNNSSMYDPYWSVAPVPIAAYWLLEGGDVSVRGWIVMAAVLLWGGRLTYNFLRGWPGLHHEDWRYVDFRSSTGRAYWLVSFLGIHLFPTILVFMGCLSLAPAMSGGSPLGLLDIVASVVTFGAIAVEATADRQLRDFVCSRPPAGALLSTGLWGRSRHPNYLGELSFWWGLFLFALAAGGGAWPVVLGPVAMTLLFGGVSIPLIERRMRARRLGWDEYCAQVPILVPVPGRSYSND